MTKWPVMKLCEKQLRDVNPNDVLCDGLFRSCDTYKGGGGYDQFPAIYGRRNPGEGPVNKQFVVQLKGCPLHCPYCYVTPDGVDKGECVQCDTGFMVEQFQKTGLPVFHLMGGAPALYLESWPELIDTLPHGTVFHSDFLLVEKEYDERVLDEISEYPYQLHAVSIKGTPETLKKNTGKNPSIRLMLNNIHKLYMNSIPFYITFTGMSMQERAWWDNLLTYEYGNGIMADSFPIEVRHYKALE